MRVESIPLLRLRGRHSRASGNPAASKRFAFDWIPGFAGMTAVPEIGDLKCA
jgi:hypothetical protein